MYRQTWLQLVSRVTKHVTGYHSQQSLKNNFLWTSPIVSQPFGLNLVSLVNLFTKERM